MAFQAWCEQQGLAVDCAAPHGQAFVAGYEAGGAEHAAYVKADIARARELRDALNLLNSIADDCELLTEALATGECATLAEARVCVQNIHGLAVTFQVRDDG